MWRRVFSTGLSASAAARPGHLYWTAQGFRNYLSREQTHAAYGVQGRSVPAAEAAEIKTHNRWHPDIPMVEMFRPGDEFRAECFNWTGGQIDDDDSANDVRDVDLTKVHYLSGPFGVESAEPGDLFRGW